MPNQKKVERLLALSHTYRFLSICLFEPDKELLELLSDKDYMDEVESCLVEIGNDKLSEFFGHVRKESQHTAPEVLLEQYRDTFGSTTVATDCPPYEMYVSGSHIFQQTQDLADISGFYRAFGLEVSEDDTANRWDHIAVQLEFLHFLTYKQAFAIENHSDEEQQTCLMAKKKFLNTHIGRWIQAFARAVERKSPAGFYRQVAKLANDFVHIDMENLGVSAEEIDELQGGEPDYLQRLEGKSAMACDACTDEEYYG
ncbi:MAG: molecular chaperone TorD family protein [Candidatus Desulfatibia sp.]|uniref:TorD/DmsD family molecular chaperone n=1 Tax=Candidatus Desulfatibia sp. TaxID=3101189 RepID=UPI002F2E6E5B